MDVADTDSMDVFARFHPAVSSWFAEQFGEPTPPQRLGWPAIASGQNTLIVAPTGSGKTLAAFLAALDHLWRTPKLQPGVRILYISPLKALNQDVWRNLQFPLEGILAKSEAIGDALPRLKVAVRSGDTPAQERARIVKKPPDILITTPESLHLMLTSRAREILRGVTHVIVDEIHAVCANKRGVFLALLLERLEAINAAGFVRIGLSATQRPLEEVARYLGGLSHQVDKHGDRRVAPRPVTIIDAGWRRELDLEVIWPRLPTESSTPSNGSIWSAIESRLISLVRDHRSTIIFANNRRTVEKLAARLNDLAGPSRDTTAGEADENAHWNADSPHQLRAHHGSISLEERRATETALKDGELAAVVATASLELGIDMGAVDLVCQVESPGSVARGLQRVGRAGHVVRGLSKGRLIAKTSADLLECAAVCRSMLSGQIEELRVPQGCLDVLAQQVIACVAMEPWDVPALFDLVRRAYPYQHLAPDAFESVLRLISGRFPTESFRDLRARIVWDRVHNRLSPLPGTAQLALVGGGTIPDTGQFPVYLGDGGPRLGELDEEFVFERRVGETFVLGNSTWRIMTIEPHRVTVARAEGQTAVMPFWRGEGASRSAEVGEAVGALARGIAERLDDPDLIPWLERECRLGPAAALHLKQYVARQKKLSGTVPDDRTILIETFLDQAGELGLAVLSPFGGRFHHALKIALLAKIRLRLGLTPACLHGDDGLLFRLPGMDEPPIDLFEGLTGASAEALIREELPETALFGLRFRQNAGRALLMPRPDPSKRTPLWLQRIRSKDLLQIAKQFADFPIVIETMRECLDDDLDLPHLRSILDQIRDGAIRVVRRRGEIPSPFTSELIFLFTAAQIYEWDEPKRSDRKPAGTTVDEDLLQPLLRGGPIEEWLDPLAVGRFDNRLRRLGQLPRTADEMAEHLRLLGDLTSAEVSGPMSLLLEELRQDDRAAIIELPGVADPLRWILAENETLYRTAFLADGGTDEEAIDRARVAIVRAFLRTHALIGLGELTARYPISSGQATDLLDRWAEEGKAVRLGESGSARDTRWAERENLNEMRRMTVAVRRREALAVAPEIFADFLLRRQRVHPVTRGEGPAFVETVLEQLQGFAARSTDWESEILPRRIKDYRPAWLDDVLGGAAWFWRADKGARDEPRVAFFLKEFGGEAGPSVESIPLSDIETTVIDLLGRHGASFATDLARRGGIEPSRLHLTLRDLMSRGLITNDRFDPVRPGSESMLQALTAAASAARAGQPLRIRPRRSLAPRPEGRWSRLERSASDRESGLLAWAGVLFERYGVLTREVVALEPSAPEWADLVPLLGRAEWRGEIRRGYYVEGLSGVQYATEEAAAELGELGAMSSVSQPAVFLCTIDPANIYGAGAPLDVQLLEGGVARLPRAAGNFLVLKFGRPILIIESYGKRLTALSWAPQSDIDSALNFLPSLISSERRILRVETYNGIATLESPGAARLAELGFVRDYPGMAYYAGWSTVGVEA